MVARRLPPYQDLYDLIITRKMSYTDVGNKFGVHYTAVCQTFRRDILKAGGTWPILENTADRAKTKIQDLFIDSGIVRELLREAYEEQESRIVGTEVYVNPRTTERRYRLKYHTSKCYLLKREGDKRTIDLPLKLSISVAASQGYTPCGTCCRLSVDRFIEALGVDISMSHMARLLSYADYADVRRIRKPTAVKLLRAIGEEPHAVLANWKPKKTINAEHVRPRKIALVDAVAIPQDVA